MFLIPHMALLLNFSLYGLKILFEDPEHIFTRLLQPRPPPILPDALTCKYKLIIARTAQKNYQQQALEGGNWADPII